MTIGKDKHRRAAVQLDKWVGQSTSHAPEPLPTAVPPVPSGLSAYMAIIGRKGGKIGGKRRLVTISKARRSKIAAKAAKVRWSKLKSK